MKKEITLPNYLPDTPYGDDFFKIHSQISEMLYTTINKENLKGASFTLGLLGSWGSGKSMTIKKLKERIKKEDDILFFEFDVWKYVDSSLYRSILIDFERMLQKKANDDIVPAEFKEGIPTKRGTKNLNEILYQSMQEAKEIEVKKPDWFSKKSLELRNKGTWGKAFDATLFSIFWSICKVAIYVYSRSRIFWFFVIMGFAFASAYYYRSNIVGWLPFLSDAYIKPIFQYLTYGVFGLAGVELFKESLKDFYTEMLPKSNHNVLMTSPPTFAQDQFEDLFKSVVDTISNNGEKKIVIVFDNIDRCESNVTIQILTGLKTFLDHKYCFYLLPCDDQRIKEHLNKKKESDDYLDKIFQACLRIPPIEEGDKYSFIKDCLSKAKFSFENSEDENKLIQILTLAYKGDTPRQIKRFFNDFVSYYRLAAIIDPEKKYLLKDIGYFALMISIKQKWQELENLILNDPRFFKEFATYKDSNLVPENAKQFIDVCLSWIDYSYDSSSFIFLKSSNSSYNYVERILNQSESNIELSDSLVKQIEGYFETLKTDKRLILFEAYIEQLKNILESKIKTEETATTFRLLQVYFKNIIWHKSNPTESKKQTFFVTHALFIKDVASFIQKLHINFFPSVQREIAVTIRSNPGNSEMLELYMALCRFLPDDIQSTIFKDTQYEDLVPFKEFFKAIPQERADNILDTKTIEGISNAIAFNRDESLFVDIISSLNGGTALKSSFQVISKKLSESLASMHNHPGEHPYDNFILKGISCMKADYWESQAAQTYSAQIAARVNILFQHNLVELALKHIIEAIRNNLPCVPSFFTANGTNNLNNQTVFQLWLTKISDELFIQAMNDDLTKNEITRVAIQFGIMNEVIAKLNPKYLLENIDRLIINNQPWMISMISYEGVAGMEGNNEKVNLYKEQVLVKYQAQFKDLIYPNYPTVIPLLEVSKHRNEYVLNAIDYFKSDHKSNAEHIANILNLVESNSEGLMQAIFNNSKVQFVELDNINLFKVLYAKLPSKEKNEYLLRLYGRLDNDLKSQVPARNILNSLSETVSAEDLHKGQRYILSIITELFEPSRNEVDVNLGIAIAKKLKSDNQNRNLGIDTIVDNHIKTGNKSDQINNELKSLL